MSFFGGGGTGFGQTNQSSGFGAGTGFGASNTGTGRSLLFSASCISLLDFLYVFPNRDALVERTHLSSSRRHSWVDLPERKPSQVVQEEGLAVE